MDLIPLLLAKTETDWPTIIGMIMGAILGICACIFPVAVQAVKRFLDKYFWVIYGVALLWYGGTYLAMKIAHDEYGNSYWSYTILDKTDGTKRSYIPKVFYPKEGESGWTKRWDGAVEYGVAREADTETQATLDKFHNSLMPALGLYWFWVVICIIRFFIKSDEGAYTPTVRTAGTAPVVVAGAAAGSGMVMEAVGKFVGGSVGRSMAQTGAALQAIGWVVGVLYVMLAGAIMPICFVWVTGCWIHKRLTEPPQKISWSHRFRVFASKVRNWNVEEERIKRKLAKASRSYKN